jgi:predicted HicB family RNase H-like nuclease
MTAVVTPGTMGSVPNKPKTPVTNFRIPQDLKRAAAERAAGEGRTLTDVIVEALERYTQSKN